MNARERDELMIRMDERIKTVFNNLDVTPTNFKTTTSTITNLGRVCLLLQTEMDRGLAARIRYESSSYAAGLFIRR